MTFLKEQFEKISSNRWIVAVLLYCIAHGLTLFCLEPILDDFIVYNVPMAEMLRAYRTEGYWHFLPLLKLYFSLPSQDMTVFAFRASIFVVFFVVLIFVNGILKTIREISPADRYFLVVMMAVMPLDCGRIRYCLSHYFESYFLFYLGFWMTAKYFQSRQLILRFCTLVVFFLSFFTPSFVVFYGVVLLYIIYADGWRGLRSAVATLVRYADFVVLPILFWTARKFFFGPSGWRQNYNDVGFDTILRSPAIMLQGAYTIWQELTQYTIAAFHVNEFLVLIAIALVFLWLGKSVTCPRSVGHDVVLFFLGLLLFFVGLFPYAAVGKMPSFFEGNSRHALLLPLGLSFTLYFGLKILLERLGVSSQMRLMIFSTVLVLFTMASARNDMDYLLDGYKHLSMITHFKESDVVRDHTTFLFKDELPDLNAKQSQATIVWDVYTGLLDIALGGQKRLGVNDPKLLSDPKKFERLMFLATFERHHFQNYVRPDPVQPQYQVTIKPGEYVMTPRRVMKFVIFRILWPDQFAADLKNMLRLEFVKL